MYSGVPVTDEPTTILLPRAGDGFGLRVKLATYSLELTHEKGGPKARSFEQILGITIDAIDYLEAQILARILDTPVTEIPEVLNWRDYGHNRQASHS
jgi:hypothetical protein